MPLNYESNPAPQGMLPSRYTSGIGGTGRAQQLGDVAANRGAYQPGMGQADQSRGAQTDSLGMARAAAMGQAPSQAEALGSNMIGQSLQSQLAGAASARGGSMAQAAATRQAQQGAAAFQQQGVNNLAGMRAQEMATARDQYGQQAGAVRGQDLSTAGLYSQNENTQRALNQQGQLGFNGQAIDIDKANAANSVQQYGIDSQNWQAQQNLGAARQRQESDISQHSTDRSTNLLASAAGAGGGVLAAGLNFLSDEHAKMNITPVVPGNYFLSAAQTKTDITPIMPGNQAYDPFIVSSTDDSRTPNSKPKGPSLAAAASSAIGSASKDFGEHAQSDMYNTRTHEALVSDERTKIPMPMNAVDPGTGTVQLHDGGMSQDDLRAAGTGLAGAAGMMRGMVGGGGITGGSVNTAGRGSDGSVNPMQHMMSDERAKHTMGSAATMAAANRALAPSAYEYKPQFTPEDQAPGEMNVGPMAQNMARNPLSATAVKELPDGLLAVDKDKALRLALGSIGSLQQQIDQMRRGGR